MATPQTSEVEQASQKLRQCMHICPIRRRKGYGSQGFAYSQTKKMELAFRTNRGGDYAGVCPPAQCGCWDSFYPCSNLFWCIHFWRVRPFWGFSGWCRRFWCVWCCSTAGSSVWIFCPYGFCGWAAVCLRGNFNFFSSVCLL